MAETRVRFPLLAPFEKPLDNLANTEKIKNLNDAKLPELNIVTEMESILELINVEFCRDYKEVTATVLSKIESHIANHVGGQIQIETRYGNAKYLRDALPNASFIGFTGTPIENEDKSTPAVFGNYIDVYDISQAVEDGATGRLKKRCRRNFVQS